MARVLASIFLLALVLMIALGANAETPAARHGCAYQSRDDFGRCPLLTYKVVMSDPGDDLLCSKIANALNSAPAGARKLYSNPIFVPWMENYYPFTPWDRKLLGHGGVVTWTIVPIFNDNKPFVVWKLHSEAGDDPRILDGAGDFEHALSQGGPFGRELDPDPMFEATGKSGRPVSFRKLSEKLKTSERWSDFARREAKEFHLVSVDGRTYLVARIYLNEIVYVVKFAPGRFTDVCYLASDLWFQSYATGKIVRRHGD